MLILVASGVITAVGVWMILMRFDRQKIAGLRTPIDIVFTGLMILTFFGTFSGMVAAAVGGVTLSLLLNATRAFNGAKRLTMKGWKRE